ncbi:MAG: CD225/dispanin family protein [Rikenellaceae bacterium]
MENTSNKPPKTWLAESILVTLFCCLPLGIIGIVNASKVESRFYSGDIEEANRLSLVAKKWTILGFWIGIVLWIIYLLIVIAFATGDFY